MTDAELDEIQARVEHLRELARRRSVELEEREQAEKQKD
jgi:hypothetical protein